MSYIYAHQLSQKLSEEVLANAPEAKTYVLKHSNIKKLISQSRIILNPKEKIRNDLGYITEGDGIRNNYYRIIQLYQPTDQNYEYRDGEWWFPKILDKKKIAKKMLYEILYLPSDRSRITVSFNQKFEFFGNVVRYYPEFSCDNIIYDGTNAIFVLDTIRDLLAFHSIDFRDQPVILSANVCEENMYKTLNDPYSLEYYKFEHEEALASD